ncbi:P1 family peptidase [Coralliovum pocilloporae]|uniref:P1 family peptidase n=1 Tax=Coralliovum pocilloporae TaxID=3066369 RepID=UPI003307C107
MKTGPLNLITDVDGLLVGNADDADLKSGTSVILPDQRSVAAVHVMGGAPGTRETDLLSPEQTVQHVDALVLSGGSAFGLDACSGVQAWLREQNRGYPVTDTLNIPIVPGAILFDMLNGGNKGWGLYPPYRDLGYKAAQAASRHFELGSTGAGAGATTANIKGGLGSASSVSETGHTIGALVAVNALGQATIGSSGHFWAHPFEIDNEFGGFCAPHPSPKDQAHIKTKLDMQKPGANTTIAVIATDAILTKSEAKRLGVMAHDGFARALWPAHTVLDGDLIFALSTGKKPLDQSAGAMVELGALAASTMARAVARGVYHASADATDNLPTWQNRFGTRL